MKESPKDTSKNWAFGFNQGEEQRFAWENNVKNSDLTQEEQLEIGVRLCLERDKNEALVAGTMRNEVDPTRHVLEQPFREQFNPIAKQMYDKLLKFDPNGENAEQELNDILKLATDNMPKNFMETMAHFYKAHMEKRGQQNSEKAHMDFGTLMWFQFVQSSMQANANTPQERAEIARKSKLVQEKFSLGPASINQLETAIERYLKKKSELENQGLTGKALETALLEAKKENSPGKGVLVKFYEEALKAEDPMTAMRRMAVDLPYNQATRRIADSLNTIAKDLKQLPPISEELENKTMKARGEIYKIVDHNNHLMEAVNLIKSEVYSNDPDAQKNLQTISDSIKQSSRTGEKHNLDKDLQNAISGGNTLLTKQLIELGADSTQKTTNYKRGIGQRFKDMFKHGLKALIQPPERSLQEIAKLQGNSAMSVVLTTTKPIVTEVRPSESTPEIAPELTQGLNRLSQSGLSQTTSIDMSYSSNSPQNSSPVSTPEHSPQSQRKSALFSPEALNINNSTPMPQPNVSTNSTVVGNGLEGNRYKDEIGQISQAIAKIEQHREFTGPRTPLQDQMITEHQVLKSVKQALESNSERSVNQIIENAFKSSAEADKIMSTKNLSETTKGLLLEISSAVKENTSQSSPKSRRIS